MKASQAPLGNLLEAEQLNQANGTIETFKKVMTSRHFESAKCNQSIPKTGILASLPKGVPLGVHVTPKFLEVFSPVDSENQTLLLKCTLSK